MFRSLFVEMYVNVVFVILCVCVCVCFGQHNEFNFG